MKFRVSDIQELTNHRPTHRKRKTKLDQLKKSIQNKERMISEILKEI